MSFALHSNARVLFGVALSNRHEVLAVGEYLCSPEG